MPSLFQGIESFWPVASFCLSWNLIHWWFFNQAFSHCGSFVAWNSLTSALFFFFFSFFFPFVFVCYNRGDSNLHAHIFNQLLTNSWELWPTSFIAASSTLNGLLNLKWSFKTEIDAISALITLQANKKNQIE